MKTLFLKSCTIGLGMAAITAASAAEVAVDFQNTTSFSNQDSVNSGQVNVATVDNFLELQMIGNRWRASSSSYEVKANTILTFDYKSNSEGEIQGIGLDEDNSLSSNRIFKLYGTQNYGLRDVASYSGGGDYQSFSIPVGNYYTGTSMRVVFANDNDVSNPTNTGFFRNVRLVTPDIEIPPVTSCELTAQEQTLVDAHNQARSEGRNCGDTFYAAAPPVSWSCKLGQIAREHSKDMADNNFMSHTGSDGSSPFDRMRNVGYSYSWASENVAAGYRTVPAVMQGWLSSVGHCKNIMNANVTEIGTSSATNTNSQYSIYWTSAFGKPR